MKVSDLTEKLRYFPQDAEVTASDYGLHCYLPGYKGCLSYDLNEVNIEDLPWILDRTWLNKNKIHN